MNLTPKQMRDIVLTALATTAGAWLTPSLPALGVPLAAVTLAWFTYRYGARAGVAVSVIATAIASAAFADSVATAASSAVFLLPAMLAAGPGTVWALRRWKVTSTVAALTVVMFVAVVAGLALQTAAAHTTIAAESAASARQMIDQFTKGVGTRDAAAAIQLKESAATIASEVAALWPAGMFLSVAVAAALAVPTVSFIGRRMGATVATLPPLADLDLSFHLVWPSIAGIALLAVDAFGHGAPSWAGVVGSNLLYVVRPALFLQGLAAFAALYRKVGVGRLGRNFGFVLLGVAELTVPSVSVVGIADLLFNPRKLPREGAGTTPATV